MNEPTTDEMLEWVWLQINIAANDADRDCAKAIHAILVQQGDVLEVVQQAHEKLRGERAKISLEAIRAFVTRVGVKYTTEHPAVEVSAFMQPWWDEIAEMENNERTQNKGLHR